MFRGGAHLAVLADRFELSSAELIGSVSAAQHPEPDRPDARWVRRGSAPWIVLRGTPDLCCWLCAVPSLPGLEGLLAIEGARLEDGRISGPLDPESLTAAWDALEELHQARPLAGDGNLVATALLCDALEGAPDERVAFELATCIGRRLAIAEGLPADAPLALRVDGGRARQRLMASRWPSVAFGGAELTLRLMPTDRAAAARMAELLWSPSVAWAPGGGRDRLRDLPDAAVVEVLRRAIDSADDEQLAWIASCVPSVPEVALGEQMLRRATSAELAAAELLAPAAAKLLQGTRPGSLECVTDLLAEHPDLAPSLTPLVQLSSARRVQDTIARAFGRWLFERCPSEAQLDAALGTLRALPKPQRSVALAHALFPSSGPQAARLRDLAVTEGLPEPTAAEMTRINRQLDPAQLAHTVESAGLLDPRAGATLARAGVMSLDPERRLAALTQIARWGQLRDRDHLRALLAGPEASGPLVEPLQEALDALEARYPDAEGHLSLVAESGEAGLSLVGEEGQVALVDEEGQVAFVDEP